MQWHGQAQVTQAVGLLSKGELWQKNKSFAIVAVNSGKSLSSALNVRMAGIAKCRKSRISCGKDCRQRNIVGKKFGLTTATSV